MGGDMLPSLVHVDIVGCVGKNNAPPLLKIAIAVSGTSRPYDPHSKARTHQPAPQRHSLADLSIEELEQQVSRHNGYFLPDVTSRKLGRCATAPDASRQCGLRRKARAYQPISASTTYTTVGTRIGK